MNELSALFRPAVQKLKAYIPGEQPQEAGWTKLNTNENPYPASPRVQEAIALAASLEAVVPLYKYPDPLVTSFRKVAADLLNVEPDWILPGNGSDEVLTMIMRAFVDPGESIAFPYPSYILYGTLAEIQGATYQHLPLNEDWSLAATAYERSRHSKVTLVPNPNSPSGHCWSEVDLEKLIPERGIFVLDEAYGDFQNQPRKGEILHTENGKRVIVTRTLSKSYSLAGLRFGYAVAHPDLIAGIRKVKDSYNCDSLAIAAATAALQDQQWMLENRHKILNTRQRLTTALEQIGFQVLPSQANFVWATHPFRSHKELYEGLKQQKILIRYMPFQNAGPQSDRLLDGLRITIGTDEQIDLCIAALQKLV